MENKKGEKAKPVKEKKVRSQLDQDSRSLNDLRQRAEDILKGDTLETSRDNFTNLYDFAPICYCTLDQKGLIRETNQMCSEIFGVEKRKLIGQRLTRFIHRDDQDQFYLFSDKGVQPSGLF